MSITSFKDLATWQEAHKLVLMIYRLTSKFPAKENFALVSQMRRAAVSISSNIAEGFSRRTAKEKKQFYTMALGSLTEVQDQLLISKDVGYLNGISYTNTEQQTTLVQKLLHGLMKGIAKIQNT